MGKLNLQLRLGIILIFFFVMGIVAQLVVSTLVVVDMKVKREEESIAALINTMFNIAELDTGSPFTEDTENAFLQELTALQNIRHIDVRIDSGSGVSENNAVRRSAEAPGWFVNMAYPEDEMKIREFQLSNGDIISIYADPIAEIEEVWFETRRRMIASFIYLWAMIGTVFYFTSRWMSPVDAIIKVLDKVEYGDFSRRITAFSLPEFRKIGDHINHLTVWLGASKSENERLIRKSILVQEQERRFLAQELHDSLGQSVSAIKAIAVSIAIRSRDSDEATVNRARNIEEIADTAYNSVRNLMTSLRPTILDELGLTESLKQMVDDWNVHHEDTFCRLRVEGDFTNLHEEQQINIYRIVQEALTNISKYAQAENVTITLSGIEVISLLIVDNGKGFAMNEITQSMGLTGIRDRVTLLRGELEIASKPGKGVSIQIEFPRVNYFRRRLGDGE